MSEVEKQEGQKTVVAFITGLLIGGLLVWVFSSSPEAAPVVVDGDVVESEITIEPNDSGDAEVTVVRETEGASKGGNTQMDVIGDGEISVANQVANNTVLLDEVTYPTANGWVVVREYADGVSGRILGAARYSIEEGLMPVEVSLLRSTEAGSTYQVVFYTENGDKAFSLTNDVMIEGGEATFTAN